MPHRHQPPARPRPAHTALVATGLAALTLLAGAGFIRELVRNRQIDREIRALHDEAERLHTRNFEVARLQSSLGSREFLEREARLKLGLRKDGEQVVVLRKAPEIATGPVEDDRPVWSNSKKWFMYFADRESYEEHVIADAAE